MVSRGLVALALLGITAASDCAQAPAARRPRVVVVLMADGESSGMRFEPPRVKVQRGDTVRFVQAGAVPHNVEFKSALEGTDLGPERIGPLLEKMGETYDVVMDRRFTSGEHSYVCTLHEELGMVGLLYLAGPPR